MARGAATRNVTAPHADPSSSGTWRPAFAYGRGAVAWGQQLAVMSKLLSLAVKRLLAWRDRVVTCTMFGALGTGPLMVTSSALSRAVAVNAQLLLSSVSVLVLPLALSAKASNVTL